MHEHSSDGLSEQELVRSLSIDSPYPISKPQGLRANLGLTNVARRTLGIVMLMITVFLWTSSNFLASYIFADNTYSKPYFVTYFNASFFALSLPPILLRIGYQDGFHRKVRSTIDNWRNRKNQYETIDGTADEENRRSSVEEGPHSPLLQDARSNTGPRSAPSLDLESVGQKLDVLSVWETAKISLEFSMLWFLANYFVASCLEYTSVASSTILTSTSSIFTLLFGAIFHVEQFTYKKLIGVLASLTGIVLISMVDISGQNDDNRGSFPHKSPGELAIGDTLAFLSAVMYGAYAIVMKKRVGNEDRVNMPLFFGFVGLFNILLLWPGFIILHYTGVETFELPPTGNIWSIILLNSASSFISDYSWAYAMLLTTPLIVSVGLSLTIPLSLVGQIVISQQYTGAL